MSGTAPMEILFKANRPKPTIPTTNKMIKNLDFNRNMILVVKSIYESWVNIEYLEESKPIFKIGKEYEFSDNQNFKDCYELLAILPKGYKCRYIADVGNSYFRAFLFISEIQPAEPKQEMKQTEEDKKKDIQTQFLESLISLAEGVIEGLK
jgi:hypothetical protein